MRTNYCIHKYRSEQNRNHKKEMTPSCLGDKIVENRSGGRVGDHRNRRRKARRERERVWPEARLIENRQSPVKIAEKRLRGRLRLIAETGNEAKRALAVAKVLEKH